jgi:hypothetical protein
MNIPDNVADPGFGEGGGGSIFWKTQDIALYSTYFESPLILTKSLLGTRK